MGSNDIELLKNAVRQPVAALTAVRVESAYRARKLIDYLHPLLGDRSFAEIQMLCKDSEVAGLLAKAREVSAQWPENEGVLFFVDETPADEKTSLDFWRAMNLQRENWNRLDCHVVFFLLTGNFKLFLTAADHLASWTPLKLDCRTPPEERASMQAFSNAVMVMHGQPSGRAARESLDDLEKSLAVALTEGQINEENLTRKYYLPMLKAALLVGDLSRAEALSKRIKEESISSPDLIDWLAAVCVLRIHQERFTDAERILKRLLTLGKKENDRRLIASVYFCLGIVARSQGKLGVAEKRYQNTLAINEELGNDAGLASTYHELGTLALARGNHDGAEKCYRRSLDISARIGDEAGMARMNHQMGRWAQSLGDLNAAETWYRKSLELSEILGNELDAAATYNQMGILAWDCGDFDAAEKWCRKSLAIYQKLGDEQHVAKVYWNLAMLFLAQRRAPDARDCLEKALQIREKLGQTVQAQETRAMLKQVDSLETTDSRL